MLELFYYYYNSFTFFFVLIVKGPIQSTQTVCHGLSSRFCWQFAIFPFGPFCQLAKLACAAQSADVFGHLWPINHGAESSLHPACTRVLQIVMVPIHCVLSNTGRYVDSIFVCYYFYIIDDFIVKLVTFVILSFLLFLGPFFGYFS